MSKKLYALLVGINDYPGSISDLRGCVSDVNHLHDYLKDRFGRDCCVEILKNSDAVRPNIIKLFREHLCKAEENDVVLFHYSGHGSRELAAPEFYEYYPDKKDETLVCFDSRSSGGFDLADKELAVLLWEVAQKNPHIAVILDCCHSGSGTREADDFKLAGVRQTDEWEPGTPRPIDTYIGGYKDMAAIKIPKSKHILMAACDRTQKAWESPDGRGLFSSTLLEVLTKSRADMSYADLFVLCRSAILKKAHNQTPQFEPCHHFFPHTKFLGGGILGSPTRYHVYLQGNLWQMDCGALHGLPTEPEKKVEVALYNYPGVRGSTGAEIAGYAETLVVGAQKSTLRVDLPAGDITRYQAEIISLPVPPTPVYLEGDEAAKTLVENSLSSHKTLNIAFTGEAGTGRFVISVQERECLLRNRETGLVIQGAKGDPRECVNHIFSVLEKVIRWERNLALQNFNTSFKPADVEFKFFEIAEDGREREYEGSDITLDLVKKGEYWQRIGAKLRVRNLTRQELHFTLVYFSEKFGIYILKNDPLPAEKDWVTLWGDQEEDYIDLAEGVNEGTDVFKLIVSTERVDDFLLVQEELEIGKIVMCDTRRAIGTIKKVNKIITDDWFTKTITIKTIRQLERVSEKDASLADRQIVVKGHPFFKANMSLSGGKSHTRSVELDTIAKVFTGEDFAAIRFSSGRGEGESVLELTDITNAESLRDKPLEIVLHTSLEEDEYVLPLTFDGTHFIPVGNPSLDKNRDVVISIDYIPDIVDVKRRGLGKALKLSFYKLVLKSENVNRLSWVEYQPDGKVVRHYNDVKEKVAKADNILMLVHGIIGDTRNMAKGLYMAVDENNRSIADRYDLILAYDYESLNTRMDETAKSLKRELKAAGLLENQDRKITVLAHSTGGLVSRWFIEQEGGSQIVKHLIMAGTPNNGSFFGNLPTYRDLAVTFLTLSLNFIQPLAVFANAFLFVLNQSKELTYSLKQVKKDSTFLKDLNLSDDPHVQYTILAGDVTNYEVDQGRFFGRLIEKIETGIGKVVHLDQPNDIVAGVDSIKGVDDKRDPVPEKVDLVCHHLNYFQSEAGLNALKKVLHKS